MEISINKWKCDQVVEWLKGLDSMNSHYIKSCYNNQIDGEKLLNLRPYELEELGIKSVGHQEIILEAVEQLRNFHFNLDKENLQQISMQCNSLSWCLYKEISSNDWQEVNTKILAEVVRITSKIKTLISWLDRNPFNQGHSQYAQYRELRVQLLRFGLELATFAHRDRFSQNPIKQILVLAEKLSNLTNYIIRDITDPLLIQPAYLDLVTLKKRESELGFYIMNSHQFIHRITDIKYNSPAHNSLKVEDGDEIIQVNYQTVIGWQIKKVLLQLEESTTDVLLTLKKRPKHTKIYGNLGMVMKLPSRKRAPPFRWENLVLPSPKFDAEFHPANPFQIETNDSAVKKIIVSEAEDSSGNESDPMTPNGIETSHKEIRMFLPKPRTEVRVLQRRHTIGGDDLKNFQSIGSQRHWQNLNIEQDNLESPSLRDKSVSFGFGLDSNQRPSTCLGINEAIKSNIVKGSLPSMSINRKNDAIEECDENNCETNGLMGASKVVRFNPTESKPSNIESRYMCNVEDTIIESLIPIPFADEDNSVEEEAVMMFTAEIKSNNLIPPKPAPRTSLYEKNSPSGQQYVEAVNVVILQKEEANKRGRLDKSYSTPSYNDEADVPPAIEPRRQTQAAPPIIPPKTWKNFNNQPAVFCNGNEENLSKVANIIDLKNFKTNTEPSTSLTVPEQTTQVSSIKTPSSATRIERNRKNSTCIEMPSETEIVTPAKVKTLTNKKKNNLIAKRRKVTLKNLTASSTIQGNLFKRERDRSEIAYWVKLYFVLVDTTLYGFKCKESSKADIVIFLNGFTVALADEVHSKHHAFKIYQQKKVFYFAAETEEALSQWMEFLEKATIKSHANLECDEKDLFSETECSDDDSSEGGFRKHPCMNSSFKSSSELPLTPTTKQSIGFGTLKKLTRTSPNNQNSEISSPVENSKFFGFFSNLNKSSEKKADIIPTNSFKTYKKVKESNGGMQLGSTLMSNVDCSSYLQSGIPVASKKKEEEKTKIVQPEPKTRQKITTANPNVSIKEDTLSDLDKPLKRSLNYLHASNPNLLDFTFNSANNSEFPKPNSSTCNWEPTSGMTLLDLMTQQLDEEKRDMYDRRVEQGIEKNEDRDRSQPKVNNEKPKVPPKPTIKNTDPKVQKIQKRSLPTRPDDEESFTDKDVSFFRSKEGRLLREFGYELICGDDTKDTNNAFTRKTVDKTKMRNDKVAPSNNSLRKKSGFIFWDKDDCSAQQTTTGFGSLRKSGKSSKQQIEPQHLVTPDLISNTTRKNSAPNSSTGFSYLTKLSFPSSSKEKKKPSIGSPGVMFRHNSKQQQSISPDGEVFTQIMLPSRNNNSANQHVNLSSNLRKASDNLNETPFPSYPDLQHSLPPTFKPEIYSLKKTSSKHD